MSSSDFRLTYLCTPQRVGALASDDNEVVGASLTVRGLLAELYHPWPRWRIALNPRNAIDPILRALLMAACLALISMRRSTMAQPAVTGVA